MTLEQLRELIHSGEGLTVEFKTCRQEISRDVYETICAFLNHYPAKLVIEQNRVLTENANRPHGYGIITPANFSPFPKNPVIARFFREIGRADELGSGVRNLFKYYHAFSDTPPELIEGDIFKIVVDVSKIARQVTPQATPQDERIKRILAFCEEPRSREEIQKFTGLKDRKYFRRNILNPLVEKGLLLLTIPEKPNSPNQKYYSKKNNGKIIPHFTPRVTPQATPQAPPQVTPQAGEKIEGLNEELKQLLEIIKINPGIQVKDIPALLANRSLKTIERQLKVLKEKSLIERRGSRKTGGYYLKEN